MGSWAAVFDWDGVIIDSLSHHETSWRRLAQEQGRELPVGAFQRGFGLKNDRIIAEILGWANDPGEIEGLSRRKEMIYRETLRAHGVYALPGVRRWLDALRAAAVPCAVASSTDRENIDCALELLRLHGYFHAIVAAGDVSRGKPNPQVFLLAAERLGVAPKRCVVFEDAVAGIEAARAAGMKAIGVATTNAPALLQAADRVVHRLDELDVNALSGWFD